VAGRLELDLQPLKRISSLKHPVFLPRFAASDLNLSQPLERAAILAASSKVNPTVAGGKLPGVAGPHSLPGRLSRTPALHEIRMTTKMPPLPRRQRESVTARERGSGETCGCDQVTPNRSRRPNAPTLARSHTDGASCGSGKARAIGRTFPSCGLFLILVICLAEEEHNRSARRWVLRRPVQGGGTGDRPGNRVAADRPDCRTRLRTAPAAKGTRLTTASRSRSSRPRRNETGGRVSRGTTFPQNVPVGEGLRN
jgi:hypothetical protein